MKKPVLLAFLALPFFAAGQDLIWSKKYDFSASEMTVATAPDGTVFIAATTAAGGDLDTGPGVFPIPGTAGKQVCVVAKLDSVGQPVWSRSFGLPTSDLDLSMQSFAGKKLRLDANGRLHIGFSGATHLFPGGTVLSFTNPSQPAIATLDAATGDVLGGFHISGTTESMLTDFCVQPDGKIVAVGYFQGKLYQSWTNIQLTSAGLRDGFIVQFDPLNAVATLTTRRVGSPSGHDLLYGVASDSLGRLFIGGRCGAIADLDPDPVVSQTFASGSGNNEFMLGLDPGLGFRWADVYAESPTHPCKVDSRPDGTSFKTFKEFSGKMLLGKYLPNGDLEDQWAVPGYSIFAGPILAQPGGHIFAAGQNPASEMSLVKLDSGGSELFALDWPGSIEPFSVAATADKGDIFLAGSAFGAVDLDPSPTGADSTSAAAGYHFFLLKFNEKCPNLALKFENVQPVDCSKPGTATAVGTGGAAPYSFEWATQPPQNGPTASFSAGGFYSVKITDAVGCSRRRTVFVGQPLSVDPAFFDLEARPFSASEFRPGFVSKIFFNAENLGCKKVDATIKIALDPKLMKLGFTPAPDAIVGDTVSWNLANWQLGEPFLADLQVQLPASAVLGDSICLFGWVETTEAEANLANNFRVQKATITGSFDPNDIAADPPGVCAENAILPNGKTIYTVHFQNTGTASAINVRVLDTLSKSLDLNSLRVLASSHSMAVERLDSTVLAFIFDQINLPDSASDVTDSNGFFQFELAQKPDLPDGELLENRAAIYFDFNEPVITNSVFQTVRAVLPSCPTVSTGGLLDENSHFSVAPNPVGDGDFLKIELENDLFGHFKIELFTLDGRLVSIFEKEKTLRKQVFEIEKLPFQNAFFVRFSDEKTSSARLVLRP